MVGTLALCLPTLYESLAPETTNDLKMSHAAAATLALLYAQFVFYQPRRRPCATPPIQVCHSSAWEPVRVLPGQFSVSSKLAKLWGDSSWGVVGMLSLHRCDFYICFDLRKVLYESMTKFEALS